MGRRCLWSEELPFHDRMPTHQQPLWSEELPLHDRMPAHHDLTTASLLLPFSIWIVQLAAAFRDASATVRSNQARADADMEAVVSKWQAKLESTVAHWTEKSSRWTEGALCGSTLVTQGSFSSVALGVHGIS